MARERIAGALCDRCFEQLYYHARLGLTANPRSRLSQETPRNLRPLLNHRPLFFALDVSPTWPTPSPRALLLGGLNFLILAILHGTVSHPTRACTPRVLTPTLLQGLLSVKDTHRPRALQKGYA